MNLFAATGNLGKDCRTNNVGGTSVCNFTLAVRSGYGDKEQTVWLDCALWGKRAEGKLPDYLKKGAQVAVSGELGTREHEGKTYLTLRLSELDLIGGKAVQDSVQPTNHGQGAPVDSSQSGLEDDIPFNQEAA